MQIALSVLLLPALALGQSWWRPQIGQTFQWQLTGDPIQTNVQADVFDIDYQSDKAVRCARSILSQSADRRPAALAGSQGRLLRERGVVGVVQARCGQLPGECPREGIRWLPRLVL